MKLADGTEKKVEIRFCNPAKQNSSEESKGALTFFVEGQINNTTRTHRLTSGDIFMEYTETKREIDADGDQAVKGIFYRAKTSSQECVYANGTKSLYRTDFMVTCNAAGKRSDALRYDNITIAVDNDDSCLFHVEAFHSNGCPTLEYAGFVQYVMNHPYILASILIGFGIASCFFGGLLFEWVVAGIAGIMVFIIVCMLASALGGFTALQTHSSLSAGRVIACIFSFVLAIGLGFVAGYFIKKTHKISLGILGGIGGFFLAFLLYGLVFAKFITQSTWMLWVCLAVGVGLGAFLVYKLQKELLIGLTAVIGGYTIIRGISMIAGGFINEFDMMAQMKSGTFELPNTFYAYLAGFIVMAVAGTLTQIKMGYKDKLPADDYDAYNKV